MLKRIVASLVLMLLTVSLCQAAEVRLTDVVAALEAPFKATAAKPLQIDDVQADFQQQARVASIDRVQRGSGSVQLRFVTGEQPLVQFFWDYQAPQLQQVISDGTTMWVYLPDNRQVIVSELAELDKTQGENPLSFLRSLGQLTESFIIVWDAEKQTEEGHYRLRLTPHKGSQYVRQLLVVVNREAVAQWQKGTQTAATFPFVETAATDALGNTTTIHFENVQVNNGLKSDHFSFKKPDDVETIRAEELMNQSQS